MLSERWTTAFGRPVIVENKPGAAGNIGAAEVARSTPDGHTVLLTLFSIVTSNPHLYDKLPFDPLRDFAPVTALAATDSVLIVHPSLQANSVMELVAHAKANPGKLNYASGGTATPGHISGEYLLRKTGARMTHVPYKGNAEAIRSVLAGETQIMLTPTTGALPHIRSGKLRALAIWPTERLEDLPAVRSFEAQGITGFDARTLPFWYGLLAPAGTPREIILRLNGEALKVLKDPQLAATFQSGRFFPIGNTPEEFAAMMREGHAAWGRVIRETGIHAE